MEVKAYFSDGMYKEFETYLPLTQEIEELITKEYYGMDYVVLESGIDREKILLIQDYVNECYDLFVMSDFAKSVKNWTEKDIDKFIEENEID